MQKHRELAKNIFPRFSLPLSIWTIANNQSDCPSRVFSLPVASRRFDVAGEDNNAWYIFSSPCIIVVLKTNTDTVHLFSKVASTTYKRQFKSSAFRYEYCYQVT